MRKKILIGISVLFGLLFMNAGLNQFLHYLPMPENMPAPMMNMSKAMMEIGWLLPLVGIAQFIGGLLFLIPRTSALGAVVIFPIMIGIVLTHLFVDPSGLPLALVLLAVNIWVIIENFRKYLPMIRS